MQDKDFHDFHGPICRGSFQNQKFFKNLVLVSRSGAVKTKVRGEKCCTSTKKNPPKNIFKKTKKCCFARYALTVTETN